MNNKEQVLSPEKRRSLYIDFIKNNNGASTKEFQDYLFKEYNDPVSKGTLSEDRKKLSDIGYEFQYSNKKYHIVAEPAGTFNEVSTETISSDSSFDRNTILKWMLLHTLSNSYYPLSFDELQNLYGISSTTLQSLLYSLKKDGYIQSNKSVYKIQNLSDQILDIDMFDLIDFCYEYNNYPSTGAMTSIVQPLYEKYSQLLNLTEENLSYKNIYLPKGRQNKVSSDIEKWLEQLNMLNYTVNKINLTTKNPSTGDLQNFIFSTGLLCYVMETNQYYLIGEITPSKKRIIFRLDQIDFDHCDTTKEPNEIYHSPVYQRIFQEMFSISLEPPTYVRIRFDNYSETIKSKVKNLNKIRPYTSNISIHNSEIIYTDTIRGLSAFAHYLRTFGCSALVEEPKKLRDMMLRTANKVIENYEGILK